MSVDTVQFMPVVRNINKPLKDFNGKMHLVRIVALLFFLMPFMSRPWYLTKDSFTHKGCQGKVFAINKDFLPN